MDNTLAAGILGAIATVAVGLFTIGYQLAQKRSEDRRREREEIKIRKLAVFSDIVAFRFSIVNGPKYTAQDRSKLNAALCRIPIEFIDDVEVIDAYKRLGSAFYAEKLVRIVNAMAKAADPTRSTFDFRTIESVPCIDTIPIGVVFHGVAAIINPSE